MTDPKSLQLACRFTMPSNSLGYCSKTTPTDVLTDCVENGKCDEVEKELSKFTVFNPYMETLAKISGQNKFSYATVEAYWLGNDLLKKAQIKHYYLLLKHFQKQGVPDWLIDELKHKVPKKFIPFHLFQVLHVGVGRATGSVPFNLDSINRCIMKWCRVKKIYRNTLITEAPSLKENEDKYDIIYSTESFNYRPDFLPGLKTGDTVAAHWNQAIKILTPQETNNLSYWTNETLLALG
jgi:hypothetical protein